MVLPTTREKENNYRTDFLLLPKAHSNTSTFNFLVSVSLFSPPIALILSWSLQRSDRLGHGCNTVSATPRVLVLLFQSLPLLHLPLLWRGLQSFPGLPFWPCQKSPAGSAGCIFFITEHLRGLSLSCKHTAAAQATSVPLFLIPSMGVFHPCMTCWLVLPACLGHCAIFLLSSMCLFIHMHIICKCDNSASHGLLPGQTSVALHFLLTSGSSANN